MNKRRGTRFVVLAVLLSILAIPLTAYADEGVQLPPPDDSQLNSARDAELRSNNAANAARNAGRNSIGRGNQNMAHGHHHMNGGQVALGAFQIAQGLLGLLASQAAGQMAGTDGGNGNNLSNIAGTGADPSGGSQNGYAAGAAPNDVSSSGASSSNVGSSGTSNTVGSPNFGAVEMSNPDVKAALASIQNQYGYQPGAFLQLLQEGADTKGIFENAPKNPMPPGEAQAAYAASRAANQDGGTSVASSLLLNQKADANRQAAGASQLGAEGGSGGAAKGGGLRDALTRALASEDKDKDEEDDLDVSPEVRAALAARDAQDRARNRTTSSKPADEMDLFDVVHQKYRERESFMRWGAPMRPADT